MEGNGGGEGGVMADDHSAGPRLDEPRFQVDEHVIYTGEHADASAVVLTVDFEDTSEYHTRSCSRARGTPGTRGQTAAQGESRSRLYMLNQIKKVYQLIKEQRFSKARETVLAEQEEKRKAEKEGTPGASSGSTGGPAAVPMEEDVSALDAVVDE